MICEETGSLVQLTGKRRDKKDATPHSQQQFYSMLVWIGLERGYKSGYAAAKFRDRYGHWPRGLSEVPMAPDAAFLNWLKSQQIAFHKRRQKEARHAA